MRAVVQRVSEASVSVDGTICGSIGKGFLVLLGIHQEDQAKDLPWMVNKLIGLRIFEDHKGKMNLALKDVQGEMLVISQFTLYGNCNGGRRPDFLEAARPEVAIPLYEKFLEEVRKELGSVQAGQFGATMRVSLINEGPVTLIIDK